MDGISLNNILNKPEIKRLLLDNSDPDILKPQIIYKYDKPFGLNLFNYKDTAHKLGGQSTHNWNNYCLCKHGDQNIDSHHGHIITGNTDVTDNQQLHEILNYGPKFRLPLETDWNAIYTEMTGALERYFDCRGRESPENKGTFMEVLCLSKRNVEKRIETMKTGYHGISTIKIDQKAVNKLKEKYVITTTDKASQNYSFICKYFYLNKIRQILNDKNNGNPTYEVAKGDPCSINDRIRTDILNGFQIKTPLSFNLPFVQLIPKFHKSPTDFRVIIASKTASTKILSKYLSNGLKLIQNNVIKYCKAINHNLGIRCCWITSNNTEILDCLDGLSKERRAKSINTFDFGQMYTNLLHKDIYKQMTEVIALAFGKNNFIWLNNYKGSWYEMKSKDTIRVDKGAFMSMIDYLVHNCFFTFGRDVYRQRIGIPMGTDCAPYLANLTLFNYEFNFMINKLKTGNYGLCRSLSNNFRYIDDISSINDKNVFERVYPQIYPDSLTLKKVNTSDKQADVLDINIQVSNGKFVCKLFDKRRGFPFKCNIFPSPLSDISRKCLYNVYYTELLRYHKICSCIDIFLTEVRCLNRKLINKGYKPHKLKFIFSKFTGNNEEFAHNNRNRLWIFKRSFD
jgi:hypothetical protein